MQTIGEKIEETRKRKGISLSEAAEATKIRKDFLLNIENNNNNYDLPEIYKRGFVKNYAKFLKLNPEKVLSQFQEQAAAQSNQSRKLQNDLFGSSSEASNSKDAFLDKPSLGEINLNQSDETAPDVETPPEEHFAGSRDLYIKSGIMGLCTLIFVFGIIWMIQSVLQTPDYENSSLPSTNESIKEISKKEPNEPPLISELPIKEITLKAKGAVYVQIRQQIDNKMLLSKRLLEGEIQTIKRKGAVDIAFTNGSLITLFADGEKDPLYPNTKGTGKITLP